MSRISGYRARGLAEMWRTIREAVKGGWAPTLRLIAVLTTLGVIALALGLALGASQLGLVLRAVLAS